jgi:ABC-type multidrug transport system ATPase subunit
LLPEISAYVQQDDIFIGSMTVREQLVFHAALRMSHKKKSEQIDRVEHEIEQMGLSKCKDTGEKSSPRDF